MPAAFYYHSVGDILCNRRLAKCLVHRRVYRLIRSLDGPLKITGRSWVCELNLGSLIIILSYQCAGVDNERIIFMARWTSSSGGYLIGSPDDRDSPHNSAGDRIRAILSPGACRLLIMIGREPRAPLENFNLDATLKFSIS